MIYKRESKEARDEVRCLEENINRNCGGRPEEKGPGDVKGRGGGGVTRGSSRSEVGMCGMEGIYGLGGVYVDCVCVCVW